MRYVSIDGQLRRVVAVIKMRRGPHSNDICEFKITSKGLVVGERLRGYRGLTTGVPGPWRSIEAEEMLDVQEKPGG